MLTVQLLDVAMSSSHATTSNTNSAQRVVGKPSQVKSRLGIFVAPTGEPRRKSIIKSSDVNESDEHDDDNTPDIYHENIVNEFNVQRWNDNGSRPNFQDSSNPTNPNLDPPVPYFPSRKKTQPKSKPTAKPVEPSSNRSRYPPSNYEEDENDQTPSVTPSSSRKSFRSNVYRSNHSSNDPTNTSSGHYRIKSSSNHLSVTNNSRNGQTIGGSIRSVKSNTKFNTEEVQISVQASSMPSTRESSYHTEGSGTIGLTPTSSTHFSGCNTSEAALMSASHHTRRSLHNPIAKHPHVPAAVAFAAAVAISSSSKNLVPGEITTTRGSTHRSPSDGSKARLNYSRNGTSSPKKSLKYSNDAEEESDARRRSYESRSSHNSILSPQSPQKIDVSWKNKQHTPKQQRKFYSIEKGGNRNVEDDQFSITSDEYNQLHGHNSLNSNSMRQRLYRSTDSRDSSLFSYVSKKSNASTLPPSVPRRFESPTDFDDDSLSDCSDSHFQERGDIFMSPEKRSPRKKVKALEPSTTLISPEFDPRQPPYPPNQRIEPPLPVTATFIIDFRDQYSESESCDDELLGLKKARASMESNVCKPKVQNIEDNEMTSQLISNDNHFEDKQAHYLLRKSLYLLQSKSTAMFQHGILVSDNDVSIPRHSISSRTQVSDKTKNSMKSNTSPRKVSRKLSNDQIYNNALNSNSDGSTKHNSATSGSNHLAKSINSSELHVESPGQGGKLLEHSMKFNIDEYFGMQCPHCCQILYAFKSTIVVQCPNCNLIFSATSMTSSGYD